MKPVQYIVANKGLGMSGGKLAAQVAHAAVNAYMLSAHGSERDNTLLIEWLGSGYTKIVLEARDTEHLLMVERFLKERGIRTALIIDEGRTEIPSHTPTALATVIVDKEDPNVQHAVADLRTYKDPKPAPPKRRLGKALDFLPPRL